MSVPVPGSGSASGGAPRRGAAPDRGTLVLDLALVALAALALAASLWLRPENLPALPLCPFRTLTGWPCPGCGLTHAFCCIGHAEFARAWACNPFGYVFYTGSLGLLAWPLVRRRWPGLAWQLVCSPWFTRVPVGLVVAMWGFGLWRLWSLA